MPSTSKTRPVNIDLRTIRLPIGGVVSILHRITGVVLVLAIPVLLYVLQMSLASADSYARLLEFFRTVPGRIVAMLFMLAIAHHLFAGVRHLMLDLDIGISRNAARNSAWWVAAMVGAFGLVAIWLVI